MKQLMRFWDSSTKSFITTTFQENLAEKKNWTNFSALIRQGKNKQYLDSQHCDYSRFSLFDVLLVLSWRLDIQTSIPFYSQKKLNAFSPFL